MGVHLGHCTSVIIAPLKLDSWTSLARFTALCKLGKYCEALATRRFVFADPAASKTAGLGSSWIRKAVGKPR